MSFVDTFINLVPVSALQGAIYAFVTLAIMIPFRILAFPDLTSEGAFPFGGAVTAVALVKGFDPVIASLAGFLAGALAGLATATLHLTLRLNTLLCGILVLTMLFSIDIAVMGKPNTSLYTTSDLFQVMLGARSGDLSGRIFVVASLVLACVIAFLWFLRTEIGMAMRAVGASQSMARAQGLSVARYTLLGLALAGGLAGLAGSLVAQNQAFADAWMGVGVVVNGLASLIIGEQIVGRRTLARQIAAPVIGAAVYFQLVSLALALGLAPSNLKLMTGVIVIALLAIPIALGRRSSLVT